MTDWEGKRQEAIAVLVAADWRKSTSREECMQYLLRLAWELSPYTRRQPSADVQELAHEEPI